MGLVKEFKEFALQGSVVDLAIGVIIGGAFGNIVNSFVEDVVTPMILTPALNAAGMLNISELTIPNTAIKYGNFLSTCISFFIIALCLLFVMKGINFFRKDKKGGEVEIPATSESLLTEIRDILKSK